MHAQDGAFDQRRCGETHLIINTHSSLVSQDDDKYIYLNYKAGQ